MKVFPEFIDGSVIVNPLTFYLDIGLVHAPRTTCPRLSTLRFTCNQRRKFDDPSIQRHMIHGNTPFFHDFFQVTIRNCITKIKNTLCKIKSFGKCVPENDIIEVTFPVACIEGVHSTQI